MSDEYNCPKEGCDYGESEDKTLAAVRSHINSASGHDWHALKAELYEQAEPDDVPAGYDPEEDDDTGEDVDEEGDDQTTESGENESEMATDDEYEEQYETQTDDDGEEEDDDQDGGGDTTSATGGSGFSMPAVNARTMVLVLGVVFVLFVAYRVYDGGGESEHATDDEQVEDTDDSEDGGLVDTDAGAGGGVYGA